MGTHAANIQWACAGSCWSLPVDNVPSDLWACPACRCAYGNAEDQAGNCYACPQPYPYQHMVPMATTLTACNDPTQYVCAQGYQGNPCSPCSATIPDCAYGYYYERCPSSGCLPCTNPIPNHTSQSYGPQAPLRPACGATYEDGACTPFLSPAWDHEYACLIYCNIGYANVEPNPQAPVPDCRPCSTVCGLGFACPYVSVSYRQCVPCSALNQGQELPSHAVWGEDCTWECAPGFYNPPGTAICTACRLDQQCIDPLMRFMACSGESPGRCVEVSPCVQGATFLHYQVFSSQAICRPCTSPTLDVTYVVHECTALEDTRLANCRTNCGEGTYRVGNCTLTQDTQCAPCTAGQPGQLLLHACSPNADAEWGPCPQGFACNGSQFPVDCAPPTIAHEGVCVCPAAMRPSPGGCEPLSCAQGWYPNASLDACSPCGDELAITLPGVVGPAACSCPPDFFGQPQAALITCWPCGDLVCDPLLQVQSPCSGRSQQEPTCECLLPPGAQVVDHDQCQLQCAPGFEGTDPSALLLSTGAPPEETTLTLPEALYDVTIIGPDSLITQHQMQMGVVWDGHTHLLAVENLLIQGVRERLTSHLSICADAQAYRFWVGFTFETKQCALQQSAAALNCSTVELLELRLDGSCTSRRLPCVWADPNDCTALPRCVTLLASGIWGNLMQAGFVSDGIKTLAMDPQSGSVLYLLLANGQVSAYPVFYYVASTPAKDRFDDSLVGVWDGIQGRALAVVGGNLYAAGRRKGTAQFFVPPDDAQALYAAGDHLLGVDGHTLVDIWNGIPLSSTVWTRYGYGRWARFNTTHLVVAPGTPCPLDTMGPNCLPMPCARLRDFCGNATVRLRGSNRCVCMPGHYRVTSGCVPCQPNTYCSGQSDTPIACPSNALSPAGSTEASQCVCRPGFYFFQEAVCLQCPVGFWCLGGRVLPIPCMPYASTLGAGSASPLDCRCNARTHGLRCIPCVDTELCIPLPTQPQWLALKLTGWGPQNSSLALQTCAGSLLVAYYDIPAPPLSNNRYGWAWVVVLPSEVPLSDCMQAAGFVFSEPVSMFTPARSAQGVLYNESCAPNSEWLQGAQTCTCIAGYHYVRSNGYFVCLPCSNGTVRARRAPDVCVPCADNSSSHAPWMGMSRCVCLPDHLMDEQSAQCVLLPQGFLVAYGWLASPAVIIALTACAGVVCMLCSALMGMI